MYDVKPASSQVTVTIKKYTQTQRHEIRSFFFLSFLVGVGDASTWKN